MRKELILFSCGGGAYVALELAYRARSHWTMFVLGGGCFLAIGKLGRRHPALPLAVRSVIGSGICTAGELLTGALFNRSWNVWDYRALPLNFRGQICLPFSLLWIPVSAAADRLYALLEKALFHKKKAERDIA